MSRPHRRSVATIVLFTLALAASGAAPALAGEPARDPSNVRITIEIGRLEGGRKQSVKSYEMVLNANGESTSLNTGARVPIPTHTATTVGGDEARSVPMTAFTYQNVGLTAKMRATRDPSGTIKLQGMLDASYLDESKAAREIAAPPTIGQLQQELNVVLRDGQAVRISNIDEPGRAPVYLDLKADVLR